MGWKRSLLFMVSFTGHLGAQVEGEDVHRLSMRGNGNSAKLVWGGNSGRTFFPQQSESLENWEYLDELYFGEGNHQKEVGSDQAWQFFRVCSVEVPVVSLEEAYIADFDQDGLANEEEIGAVGSDPLLADSDGDGLPDGWEVAHGLNALDDGSLDPARGPDAPFGGVSVALAVRETGESPALASEVLANLDAYSLGVQANPSAGPDDLDGDGLSNCEDADPSLGTIAWRRREWPPQFAFRILQGWDRSIHGYVRSINNRGEVLADKALFSSGSWIELPGIRSSFGGPAPPTNYEFLINGRLHQAGVLSLPRAGWLSDDGFILGNGSMAIHPVTELDPASGELTTYNPGAQPGFAFLWRTPFADPEILGRDEGHPIEGARHSETASMSRDGSVALLQKQFKEGVPISNDYRLVITNSFGDVRTSPVLSSPGLPKKVEVGGAVAFGTFSHPPSTYRGWTWLPGQAQPRTLWSGWQLQGDAPPDYQFPTVIGRLPNGSVCISVGGRTFVQQDVRWNEVPKLEGAKFVSPSGMIIVNRPSEAAAVWNGENEIPLAELVGGVEVSDANFVVEDVNDGGVALARLTVSGGTEVAGMLIPAEMVPDYNRDGRIDDRDRGKVSPGNPWRWWVNNDSDNSGDRGGEDVPGNLFPDGADALVDGMRDLIDFFPLHLDLRQLLEAMPADSLARRRGLSSWIGITCPIVS